MNLGFTQLVQDPTRGDNILDVILCDHPFLIANIEVCECFSTSDHSMVKFTLNVNLNLWLIHASIQRRKEENLTGLKLIGLD
jgi:hypothetical protein